MNDDYEIDFIKHFDRMAKALIGIEKHLAKITEELAIMNERSYEDRE